MASPTLKFKRGAYADLPTLAVGEPGFTTDRYQLYVGSPTGNQLVGAGEFWSLNSNIVGGGIKLYEGTNNGTDFIELKANDSLSGITTYSFPVAGSSGQFLRIQSITTINGDSTVGLGWQDVITDLVEDTSPQLGGNLDLNSRNITGTGDLNFTGGITLTGSIIVGGTVDGRDVLDDGQAGDNLVTLSGVARDATNLGTFTGTTIADNVGIKTALQELETELETIAGGGAQATSIAVGATDTDSSHFLTFVDSNNTSPTQESVKTDAGISYNPNSNILTVGSLDVTNDITVGGTVDGRDVLDDGQAGDNLVTLSGVARDATNLGSFTGSTISDNLTVKAALQEVETSLESKLENVAEDTSPQLGGDLDLSSSDITGTGNINITGTIQGTSVEATTVYVDVGVGNTDFENVILTSAGTDGQGSLITDIDRHLSYRPSDNTFWANRMINPQRTASEELTIFPISNMAGYESDYPSAVKITAIKDEDNMSSNSATSLVTQQSVKAYVDSEITGVAVTFAVAADTGTAGIVTTGTTLTISGTANEVDTAVANNVITIGLPDTVSITTELNVPTVDTGAIRAADGTAAQTIADSTGKVTTSTDQEVQGTFTAAGAAILQGDTDIGDQTSDTVTITARVDSNFIPSTDGVRSLGSSSLNWDQGYIDKMHGDSSTITGIATAGEFKGTTLTITGGGSFGGNVEITGNLSVGGSVTNIDVEDLRIVSPVIELGLERLTDGSLQPPSNVTTYNSGVVMYYNHVGINSTNAQIAAMFAKVKEGGDMRIGFATDVTITTVGAGDSVASVAAWAEIEAKGLWINDCAGVSQVISCSDSTRLLENITVDGGTFT